MLQFHLRIQRKRWSHEVRRGDFKIMKACGGLYQDIEIFLSQTGVDIDIPGGTRYLVLNGNDYQVD